MMKKRWPSNWSQKSEWWEWVKITDRRWTNGKEHKCWKENKTERTSAWSMYVNALPQYFFEIVKYFRSTFFFSGTFHCGFVFPVLLLIHAHRFISSMWNGYLGYWFWLHYCLHTLACWRGKEIIRSLSIWMWTNSIEAYGSGPSLCDTQNSQWIIETETEPLHLFAAIACFVVVTISLPSPIVAAVFCFSSTLLLVQVRFDYYYFYCRMTMCYNKAGYL